MSVAADYAEALAAAITASLRADPPPGRVVRVVIRWFEGADYLTIHALGTGEEGEVAADDAWYPLEWPNEPREIERVRSVFGDPEVAATATALTEELEDGGWPWDLEVQPQPLISAARRLRELLEADGVPLAEHFAVGVCHFEGWGNEASVPVINPPAVVALLRDRGLEPGD